MKRDVFFDGLRGLCIVLVISIHSSNIGKEFYSHDKWSSNFIFYLIWTQFIIWAVPCFFFVSGYFFATSQKLRPLCYSQYLRRRVIQVSIPYVFWSLIFSIYYHKNFSLLNIIGEIASGSALGPYYFVVSLIFLMVVSPLLLKNCDKPWFLALVFFITITHLAASYIGHINFPHASWWYFMVSPTAWLAYYVFGLLIGDREASGKRTHIPALPMIIAFVALWGACTLEAIASVAWLGVDGGAFQPVKLTSEAFAFAAILLSLSLRDLKLWRLLAPLGTISFGIYLIHEPIRGKVSSLLSNLHWLYEFQPGFQVVLVSLTLAISVSLVFVVKQFIPRVAAHIGFR